MIASIARSASVSSSRPASGRAASAERHAPPRESSSRSASDASARRRRSGSLRATSATKPLGRARRHAQPALDLRRRLARAQAQRDRERVAQPLSHQVGQPRQPLALLAQAQVGERRRARRRRRRARRPARRPATRPNGPREARCPRRATCVLAAVTLRLAIGQADAQRELLELAQQPLLALADLRDERLRRGAVERDAHARRLLAHPAGQLPRLDGHLGDDLPPGALDRLVERRWRLGAGLLAREQRERGVGRHLASAGARCFSTSACAPALDAFDEDHPPAGPMPSIASVIAASACATAAGAAASPSSSSTLAAPPCCLRRARAARRGARRSRRDRRRGSDRRASAQASSRPHGLARVYAAHATR